MLDILSGDTAPNRDDIIELVKPWVLTDDGPVTFVREVFGVQPDAWQVEALKSLYSNERTALISNKGPGKSCVLAWGTWWFETVYQGAQAVGTSITRDNLRDGYWKELNYWYSQSKLLQRLFEFGKERIELKSNPGLCWVSARSWDKDADAQQQANSIAGFHAPNTLCVGDEAGGYPIALLANMEASLAGPGMHRILLAGNPTNTDGFALYEVAVNQAAMWKVIRVTGDPDNPMRSPRVPIKWAREQIAMYGRDHPYVMVNVFGEFPPSNKNALIGPEEVRAAMNRNYMPEAYNFAQKRIGVDVALQGDDSTVLYPRQGLVAFEPEEMKEQDPARIAARVMEAKRNWNSEVEFIDNTGGWGSGVVSHLQCGGFNPVPIQFAGKALDPGFFNKRTEMWWEMIKWIRNGGELPHDDKLVRELVAPTYSTKNGKILLEPKEHIKQRLGFSPDRADALALSFAWPEMPAQVNPVTGMPMPTAGVGHALMDYNPFE